MKRKITLSLPLAFLILGACGDTLVFGERTGFNLAVRTDAAEGLPLEVNAGLQRRVLGLVPDTSEEGGGEAVNMVSAFNLQRSGDDATPLSNTLVIESSFASGQAAIEASESTGAIEAIFDLPGVTASQKPPDISATGKILDWLNEDMTRATEYNDFLRSSGVQVQDGPSAFATATKMAVDSNNAAINLRFVSEKKL